MWDDDHQDWEEGLKVLVGFRNVCLIMAVIGGLILLGHHWLKLF